MPPVPNRQALDGHEEGTGRTSYVHWPFPKGHPVQYWRTNELGQ